MVIAVTWIQEYEMFAIRLNERVHEDVKLSACRGWRDGKLSLGRGSVPVHACVEKINDALQ